LKDNPKDAIFCLNCGKKFRKPILNPNEKVSIKEVEKPSPNRKPVLVIVGSITAVFILATMVFASTSGLWRDGPNSAKEPYTGYLELKKKFEAVPISSTDCDSAAQLIENEPFALAAAQRLETSQTASNALTIFNADEFIANNPWVRTSLRPESMKPYGDFIRELSDPILNKAVTKLDTASQDEFEENSSDIWYRNYGIYLVETCGLSEKLKENRELVLFFESAIEDIIAKSEQKPWYPEGFQEVIGFPGFAFKSSDRACTYSFGGACAVFDIVSKTACPSNLYVQTNLLNGGVIVDWSNDTAVVRAGQVARMETTFSSSSGNNWEFATISCY
jgi:hypothetical protein